MSVCVYQPGQTRFTIGITNLIHDSHVARPNWSSVVDGALIRFGGSSTFPLPCWCLAISCSTLTTDRDESECES